ncbi:hypothetical protein [Saccharopolyspora spinosa]|uniref:Uncharacterized protein n=1 Tax=Saccharopolyspora spinosa TaxID=60894 RepID=A0A2N3XR18_SACSN|nr:hypothetical protein [Saccharopolyspora spinosa]PKW13127.1 hypothetical protein A8926_0634 [Saccharopolyspora spinosa]
MATKQRRPADSEVTATTGREAMTVNLPGMSAEFHKPDHYIPTRDDLAGAVNTVRENLPSPQMMAFYGGLGALAALSVIEWPVAAVIGVGTAITQRAGAGAREGKSGSSS